MLKGREADVTGPQKNLSGVGNYVKDGIVCSLRGIDEIEVEIVSLVRNAVSGALRATGDIADTGIVVTGDA